MGITRTPTKRRTQRMNRSELGRHADLDSGGQHGRLRVPAFAVCRVYVGRSGIYSVMPSFSPRPCLLLQSMIKMLVAMCSSLVDESLYIFLVDHVIKKEECSL